MGFYPPSSLVRDGQRRGIDVQPPDVNASDVLCRLEGDAVRVGLGYIKGLGEDPATALAEERHGGRAFRSRPGSRAAGPARPAAPEVLAASGACDSFGWPRRQLLWRLGLVPRTVRPARAATIASSPSRSGRHGDSRAPGAVLLGAHAGRLPNDVLLGGRAPARAAPPAPARGGRSSADFETRAQGARSRSPGLVVARQRPATANGVVFMLLEDEHGQINLVVPPARLRPLPGGCPRRAAASRPRPFRARRAQPEPHRRGARLALGVCAPGRKRSRGAIRAPLGAQLRAQMIISARWR